MKTESNLLNAWMYSMKAQHWKHGVPVIWGRLVTLEIGTFVSE